MPISTVFDFEDYRSFIQAKVDEQEQPWGQWARLAKAADCQAPYLSQVMKGKAQLTSDHVLGLSAHWRMNDEETDFFLMLLELSRVGTDRARSYLREKIRSMRKAREDLSKRLNQPRLEIGEKEAFYYSAWYWSAIHILVSIPEYQESPAIAERLQLPQDFVIYALDQLEQFNIVRRDGKKWKLGTADIHVPKDSVMIGMHHNNWRQRAVTDSTMRRSESIHYTAIYSISHEDRERLRTEMLALIENSRKIVAPSKEEDMVCFACDLFRA